MNKIKKRFYLGFVLTPLISLLLAKALYICASITASDIYYTGSASALLRSLPYMCKYGYIVFDQLFTGASVAAVIYAATYFGRKTAVRALFASVLSYLTAFLAEIVYNLLRNSLSASQIAAAAFAMLSELLLLAAILVCSIVAATVFLKKSFTSRKRNRLKAFSIYRAALVPMGVSILARIFDITCFNVIPFLREYDDIRPDEIVDIALDYAYYIGVYFVLAYALTAVSLALCKSLTGALKPKFTGDLK